MQVEVPQVDDSSTGVVQKIIARYEYEEDEFLRELEDMQAQVSSQRSSVCDDAPVLGAVEMHGCKFGEHTSTSQPQQQRYSNVVANTAVD
ncbi:unnamed protein product [Enterobius vermicularis]|uniref:CACTA en-spm transposon protein n=1 Tax=Enterobius vermicularis TaxID=51028 RepID=A0A0N4VHJ2_ENTVE|nr:unnamed protein product [Enterobius vermicularis]